MSNTPTDPTEELIKYLADKVGTESKDKHVTTISTVSIASIVMILAQLLLPNLTGVSEESIRSAVSESKAAICQPLERQLQRNREDTEEIKKTLEDVQDELKDIRRDLKP